MDRPRFYYRYIFSPTPFKNYVCMTVCTCLKQCFDTFLQPFCLHQFGLEVHQVAYIAMDMQPITPLPMLAHSRVQERYNDRMTTSVADIGFVRADNIKATEPGITAWHNRSLAQHSNALYIALRGGVHFFCGRQLRHRWKRSNTSRQPSLLIIRFYSPYNQPARCGDDNVVSDQ